MHNSGDSNVPQQSDLPGSQNSRREEQYASGPEGLVRETRLPTTDQVENMSTAVAGSTQNSLLSENYTEIRLTRNESQDSSRSLSANHGTGIMDQPNLSALEHVHVNTTHGAVNQLLRTLRSPATREQQQQVLQILRDNPPLMTAYIRYRTDQQLQREAQQQQESAEPTTQSGSQPDVNEE